VILWSADKAVPSHLLVAVEVDIIQIDAHAIAVEYRARKGLAKSLNESE